MPDGSRENSQENRLKIIKTVRSLKPKICFIPYWEDRHPDHECASRLLKKALFDTGLRKIDTGQEAYRPKSVIYYMLHHSFNPTFVVDISDQMAKKLDSIKVYVSQFSSVSEKGSPTYINKPEFLKSIITRAEFLGQQVGVSYAEGFYYPEMMKIDNLITYFS